MGMTGGEQFAVETHDLVVDRTEPFRGGMTVYMRKRIEAAAPG